MGFVFWPGSARFIEPERARAIVRSLPAFVVPIGVFVDQARREIEDIATLVRLGAVQLHGQEPPNLARALSYRVIKAIPLAAGGEPVGLDDWTDDVVLLDAHDPARRGGTGQTIDWRAAGAIARRRPIVLAGGLTPENVACAIGQVRPAAVDVSSGVESAPGIKDHARMRAFAAAVVETGGVP